MIRLVMSIVRPIRELAFPSFPLLSTFTLLLAFSATVQASSPNIVLIMADDVSPDMFGCYSSADAETPNIDRMARDGVQFQTAWAAALCLPARAEIMTGRYASRTGFWSNGFAVPQADGSNDLFRHHHSFGKLMQQAGYATAVAGKWHVGGAEQPGEPVVGFDEYCLWEGQRQLDRLPNAPRHTGAWENDDTTSRYWHPCIVRNHHVVATEPDDFGPAIFTEFLCDFMQRNAKAGKPFLAYYPMVAPHGTRGGQTTCPLYGEVGDLNGTKQDNPRRFRALNNYIDVLVGRLIQKAEDLGISRNTVFIFCSDNGTAVTAKSRGVERGCRVPLVVWGAGIQRRGATGEICDLADILPTLIDFSGAKLPQSYDVDGQSLKPFLTGQTDQHRDYIFACIGTTRLVRTRTHLLEVVNPVLGVPEGRFYFCGTSHDGRGYQRVDGAPGHGEVRKALDQILARHPGLTEEHPYFQQAAAARWLDAYRAPAAREKHLYNHKDYQFYDESLQDD